MGTHQEDRPTDPGLSSPFNNRPPSEVLEDDYSDVYAALQEPLPAESVQKASAERTNKGYDTTGYLYQAVVDRFNTACGINKWGFTYDVIHEDTVQWSNGTAHQLTVETTIWVMHPSIQKSCIGGHVSREYYNALKGAVTNSLKKTAALYGVGRQAYLGQLDDGEYLDEDMVLEEPIPSEGNGDNGGSSGDGPPLDFIYMRAKAKGLSDEDLEERAVELYDRAPDELPSSEREELLDWVNQA